MIRVLRPLSSKNTSSKRNAIKVHVPSNLSTITSLSVRESKVLLMNKFSLKVLKKKTSSRFQQKQKVSAPMLTFSACKNQKTSQKNSKKKLFSNKMTPHSKRRKSKEEQWQISLMKISAKLKADPKQSKKPQLEDLQKRLMVRFLADIKMLFVLFKGKLHTI